MPSRWDAATHGWSRRVFHYPLPTLMSRNFRLPYTIELQPLSLTPLKMRKVEFITSWLNGHAELSLEAGVSSPFKIFFTVLHTGRYGTTGYNTDPDFSASVSAMSVTLPRLYAF